MTSRLVVVGSGVAGLYAAVAAAERGHEAVLVTKDRLADSNSWFAQGGLAAVGPQGVARGDSVEAHVADTLAAGARLNDESAVRLLCGAAWDHVERLVRLGTSFDTAPRDGSFLLGLEGAHAQARILHSEGDATGRALASALIVACRSLQAQGRLEIREHTAVEGLVHDGGAVTGVRLAGAADTGAPAVPGIPPSGAHARGGDTPAAGGGDIRFYPSGAHAPDADTPATGGGDILRADAVLLATGGIGGLYPWTTNPAGATGDGAVLAWEAGAVIADAEFVQFHPTLVPDGPFMVSEAVRGEGAVLLDGLGRRFMPELHPAAELAPRDVVARAIHRARAETGTVLLDATVVERDRGSGFLARRFPGITARLAELGHDLAAAPVPVAEAQHYWMGGVLTDAHGRTTVPGLLAAGETACTGVHGANRLASNSLLEALVYGWRAAAALEHPGRTATEGTSALAAVVPLDTAPGDVVAGRAQLHAITGSALAVEREGGELGVAAKQLAQWRAAGSGRAARETAGLLVLSRIVAAAAELREDSLGAHFRTDHPLPPARLERRGLIRQGATTE